jgi:hypothetical protein
MVGELELTPVEATAAAAAVRSTGQHCRDRLDLADGTEARSQPRGGRGHGKDDHGGMSVIVVRIVDEFIVVW